MGEIRGRLHCSISDYGGPLLGPLAVANEPLCTDSASSEYSLPGLMRAHP
jgi:hypothetical protein